jgi:hypothetical protein
MSKVTDTMLGYAVRLAIIVLAGWLVVELVYNFKSTPKVTTEEQQRPGQ